MTVYRIAKWDEVFETAESRRYKTLNWVAMPVSLTSNGYQMMLDDFEERAPAVYGAWCALVAVAATCSVRGVLCNSRGEALKIGHISRRTGFDTSLIETLIQWASASHIGWLEIVTQQDAAALAAQVPKRTGTYDHPAITQAPPSNHPEATREIPELHNPTQPNLTKPNITQHQPNLTGGAGGTGTGSDDGLMADDGADLVSGLDQAEVARQASKLRKAAPAMELDDVWQCACLAEMLSPGLISTLVADLKSAKVRKPKAYLESVFRNETNLRGIDLARLKRLCPPNPVTAACAS